VPQVTRINGSSDAEIISKIEKQSKGVGRYHVGINKKNESGHVIAAERLKSGELLFYDAQSGEFINIKELDDIDYIELLKVDKLLFNVDMLKAISKVI